ncbi:MAG: hypothetical protein NTW05_16300 [Pseudonocardiales bacterium]|nr:hypothetical protein [Pseudonocardiales bacterium]
MNTAEECHDPGRILPRAMPWGTSVAAAIPVVVAVPSSTPAPANEPADAGSSALCRGVDRLVVGPPRPGDAGHPDRG